MQAAQNNPAIAKAWGVIKVLSGDERARALAEQHGILADARILNGL
ncbi:hypothetical protein FACS189475_10090 [Betaproteobacteria bacterium]|nr:hypothetical protein FACS189475_10090 [Betaproteobacteria bacterium]